MLKLSMPGKDDNANKIEETAPNYLNDSLAEKVAIDS